VAALFASAAFASSAGATVFVETTGSDTAGCGTTQALACQTINFGISQALIPHDTVQVGVGTFTEQVVINKDVVLKGSGLSSTVIASPASLATEFTRLGANIKPIVYVNTLGSGSAIQDLTVDGKGLGGSINRFWGVAFQDTSATASHIRVVRMRDTPFNGAQNGLGILSFADDSSPHTVAINNTTVSDFQKGGITSDGVGMTTNISGSTVLGQGPTDQIAQNGIQFSNGGTGTISHSHISGFSCTIPTTCGPGATVSVGVLLFGPGTNMTVSDNTITDSDVNVLATGVPHLDITGNDISGTTVGGISIDGGGSDGAVTGNITGNTVTGEDQGIAVFDGGAAPPQPSPVINLNRIVGNQVGVYSDTTLPIDATHNWWGCNTGPNTAGCDTTGGNTGSVNSNPWLVFRATANPSTIGTGGEVSTIRGRVDQDSNGAAVNTTGFPPSLVTFATTLGDIDPSGTTVNGIARSSLSSGDTPGTANVTATLDSQNAPTQVVFGPPSPGPTGPTGTNGTNGTNGAAGPTGPTGANGLNGTDGTDGTNGATGPTGANGPQGATGPAGADGAAGLPGQSTPAGQAQPNPITITSTRLRRDSKGRIAVRLSCPSAASLCDGRLTLNIGRQKLGTVPFFITGGKRTTVRIKPSAKLLALATRKKKVSLSVFSRDFAGTAARTAESLPFG
jgi:hypothetical protein